MSKKRRTMREKLASGTRRHVQTQTLPGTYSLSSVLNTPSFAGKNIPIHKNIAHDYSYVTLDARNTFFVTSLLITINILLAVALHNKIIKLPFLGF